MEIRNLKPPSSDVLPAWIGSAEPHPNRANEFLAGSIDHAFRSLNGEANQVNRSILTNSKMP
jgi:hypothetical protein